eukprot:CAMPEP_0197530230 /NCGR_PEP_ID=MMETSP1318-20131121/31184_1 /TAXON_ID=552666 /ORGANISM="Partenskyella glossopodia, Strain RCC365" /LENGTH=135 /DNA_ID=CAMNT_0043085961 /DNA_START=77 /DNA_END=481 /DNA_ORIENTATION=-
MPDERRYSRGGLGPRVMFGSAVGAGTGVMLGAMDSLNLFNAMASQKLRKTTTNDKIAMTLRSGAMFAAFGALYQGLRHYVDIYTGKSDTTNAVVAGLITTAPFAKLILQRRFNLAYGIGLIFFDEMNDIQQRKDR